MSAEIAIGLRSSGSGAEHPRSAIGMEAASSATATAEASVGESPVTRQQNWKNVLVDLLDFNLKAGQDAQQGSEASGAEETADVTFGESVSRETVLCVVPGDTVPKPTTNRSGIRAVHRMHQTDHAFANRLPLPDPSPEPARSAPNSANTGNGFSSPLRVLASQRFDRPASSWTTAAIATETMASGAASILPFPVAMNADPPVAHNRAARSISQTVQSIPTPISEAEGYRPPALPRRADPSSTSIDRQARSGAEDLPLRATLESNALPASEPQIGQQPFDNEPSPIKPVLTDVESLRARALAGAKGETAHLPSSSIAASTSSGSALEVGPSPSEGHIVSDPRNYTATDANTPAPAHVTPPYPHVDNRVTAGRIPGRPSVRTDPSFSVSRVGTAVREGMNLESSVSSLAPIVSSGAESAASRVAASRLVHEPFAAIDAASTRAATTWIAADTHRAEAGFQDPSIGWVAVRAQGTSASTIHATIVPATAEAAQVLSSHLAGLTAHIATLSPHLETISLSAPDAGAGQAMNEYHGTNQHEQQQQQRPEAVENNRSLSEDSKTLSATHEEIHYVAAAEQHISIHV